MFHLNEVLRFLEYLLLLCGSATVEATSTVTYMAYATVALRLLVALIQMAWILARLARPVRRWYRQRARVRRRAVPTHAVHTGTANRAEDRRH